MKEYIPQQQGDVKYLATMRLTFMAANDIEASIMADAMLAVVSEDLDEDSTADLTQLIPITGLITPQEMVEQMNRVIEMLIHTRMQECLDLARWMHQTAYVLKNRTESDFNISGYDQGAFMELVAQVLNAKH